MPRSRNPFPSYLPHRQSGRARAVWTDTAGVRRYMMLPGLFDSPESRNAFLRMQLELETAPHSVKCPDAAGISLNELLEPFSVHAERHYRTPDGAMTSEVREYKLVIRHIRELYGLVPATDFGPLKLKAVRQRFVGEGWCRGVINQRIGRIVRIFKWSVAEELVPPSVYQALAAVSGLRLGRSDAPESKPIQAVDTMTVSATLPFLNRHLRAMVALQQLTGMRPGEVCRMRLAEIDRSSERWTYRPSRHKTQHHGKNRVVMIGPRGRAVIEAFVAEGSVVDPSGPLFSPRRAREERFAVMRENRKTPVQPSQLCRRLPKPKLNPAEEYTPNAYADAVSNAAKRAGVPHWHPNMIRHTFASEVRKVHGLEAAQVLLGHSRADVTQVYAERNEELAATVAAKIG